jgi:hypothetical protein
MSVKKQSIMNLLVRTAMPLTGLEFLLWFLVRVLPKPSRAAFGS